MYVDIKNNQTIHKILRFTRQLIQKVKLPISAT